MDSIDSDIRELYKQNKRIPPEKFMIILLSVMGIDSAIIIASFYQKSLFIRIVLELVSGILMVSYFLWFFLRIYKK